MRFSLAVMLVAVVGAAWSCKDSSQGDGKAAKDDEPARTESAPPAAGGNWTRIKSGTSNALKGIWGSSPQDIYAAGAHGTILHSTDGAATWNALDSGVDVPLTAVWGSGPEDVYVVGGGKYVKIGDREGVSAAGDGVVLHSVDRGKTWDKKILSGAGKLVAVGGASAGGVHALSGTKHFVTEDGGKSWAERDDAPRNAAALWVVGPDDYYLVGDGAIVHIAGGKRVDGDGAGGGVSYTGVWASGPDNVYVSGNDGRDKLVLRSTDGGKSWKRFDVPSRGLLDVVYATGPEQIYVGGAMGSLFRSTDRGATWTDDGAGTSAQLNAFWGSGNLLVGAGNGGTIIVRRH